MEFKRGAKLKGVTLVSPTEAPGGPGRTKAWVCDLGFGELKIIREYDLKRRRGVRPGRVQAAINRTYQDYVRRCRLRNIYWELTLDQFHALSQQPCGYCGKPPSNGGRKGVFLYNGIDRKANTKGYTQGNALPCCARCNAIKSHLLSYEEMRVAMRAILSLKRR